MTDPVAKFFLLFDWPRRQSVEVTLATACWLLIAALPISAEDTTPAADWTPHCAAEWEPARDALVYSPSSELFYGVIHPDAALFERVFSSDLARQEHLAYVAFLESQDVRCHSLEEVLLHGTLDESGNAVPGAELTALQKLARKFIHVRSEGFGDPAAQEAAQQQKLDGIIRQLHPCDLVRIVILQPTIHLTSTGTLNTGVAATYSVEPVMNLYFQRDQMITTSQGVVIGRMNSQQRRVETEIDRFALAKLGIQPIYEVQEPGRLEGGDFIPAGDYVFIGQGLRTNAEAIRQLLAEKVFGDATVVVVKDARQQQDQMHLDTYFNVIGPHLMVVAENRINAAGESGNSQRLLADVYLPGDDGYSRSHRDIDLVSFLRDELQTQLVPVSEADQARYGCNFLTLSENKIVMVKGVSEAYVQTLQNLGVEVHQVDFANLTGGYGACHCTVQVLRRDP